MTTRPFMPSVVNRIYGLGDWRFSPAVMQWMVELFICSYLEFYFWKEWRHPQGVKRSYMITPPSISGITLQVATFNKYQKFLKEINIIQNLNVIHRTRNYWFPRAIILRLADRCWESAQSSARQTTIESMQMTFDIVIDQINGEGLSDLHGEDQHFYHPKAGPRTYSTLIVCSRKSQLHDSMKHRQG